MEGSRLTDGRDSRAGFVLTGGRSSRMGRDKAMLPLGRATLVEHVAARVRAAAGNVTLIGAPERYEGLGLPTLADRFENRGPLGGIYTALKNTTADWNLIVACDMPALTAEFLSSLLAVAEQRGADCLVPQTSDGLHPLCAVYHRRALGIAEREILRNSLKVHDFLACLQTETLPAEAIWVENVNTERQWISR